MLSASLFGKPFVSSIWLSFNSVRLTSPVSASQLNWYHDSSLAEPTPGLSIPYNDLSVCNAGLSLACFAAIDSMDKAIDAVSTTTETARAPTSSTVAAQSPSLRAREVDVYTSTIVKTEYYCAVPTLTTSCTTIALTPTTAITASTDASLMPKTGHAIAKHHTMTDYPLVPSSARQQTSTSPTNGTAKSSPVQTPLYGNNASTFASAMTNACVFALTVAVVALLSD